MWLLQVVGQSAGSRHPTGMHYCYCYCLQTKLKERNFFMSVCHYVHSGIMHPEDGRFHIGYNPPPPEDIQSMGGHAIDIVHECILVPKIITDVIQAQWSVI